MLIFCLTQQPISLKSCYGELKYISMDMEGEKKGTDKEKSQLKQIHMNFLY